ncbi:unnamed protein product [Closterium sp. NIES-54]
MNVVSGIWLYKVKRPPGAPPMFKARYVARGFSQREGVDFFQTFAPTPKMTTLWPTPLAMDHGLTAPHLDEPFEFSGPYPELVGCLMYLMICTRPDLAYPLSILARFVAPGRHQPSYWDATKRVAKYMVSTSGMGLVLGGKQPITLPGFSDSSWADDAESLCEAEVYAAAMASQELRWPSFLLTYLGERPHSPPVLFDDNRSPILLCQEPRLVGKAKHIQTCYFLLRELQQRGQALVQCVVSKANTAYFFTKALPPCDHQRFCTRLGLVSTGSNLLL